MSDSTKHYSHSQEPTPKSIAEKVLGKRFLLDNLRSDLFPPFCCMSASALEEDFGSGNGDIDRKFYRISNVLLDLAYTGRIDRDAFKAGEQTLADLIAGVRKKVEGAKKGVNPAVAEENILFDRMMRNICSRGMTRDAAADDALETPATPNEIDEMQQEALDAYSLRRERLHVLIELHNAVHAINTMLDREPPARRPAR